MKLRRTLFLCTLPLLACLAPASLSAERIGAKTDTTVLSQALRFFSLQDPSVQYALIGSVLLGVCCGLLGSFIVVRKMSLFGDTLSHAVLPGVALGFLWNMTKDPFAIMVGATLSGMLGALTVSLIKQTTHLKEDAAMGMVLAGFYGVGICLITMIQGMAVGNIAGLDKYLFGQAAALSEQDIHLMLIITAITIILIFLAYKEYLVVSFDIGFSKTIGIPANVFHYALILLLSFAIVVALQAVGVVLVSAMLITPAAAAYLLTDRMHHLLILSAIFGTISGALGAFLSFLGNNLPTGPFMVISASTIFIISLLLGPRYGIIPRWIGRLRKDRRIQMENMLKAAYHVRESNEFKEEGVSLHDLEVRKNEPLDIIEKQVKALIDDGFATANPAQSSSVMIEEQSIYLTPKGWERACEIVRNHRLWELYLTSALDFPADHVHDDAEIIEHVLGEDTVRRLEKSLNYPSRDPHGKLIPGILDLENPEIPYQDKISSTGYRSPSW